MGWPGGAPGCCCIPPGCGENDGPMLVIISKGVDYPQSGYRRWRLRVIACDTGPEKGEWLPSDRRNGGARALRTICDRDRRVESRRAGADTRVFGDDAVRDGAKKGERGLFSVDGDGAASDCGKWRVWCCRAMLMEDVVVCVEAWKCGRSGRVSPRVVRQRQTSSPRKWCKQGRQAVKKLLLLAARLRRRRQRKQEMDNAQ